MIKFQSFLSGSSGNCTFVTNDKVHVLVDCGAGGRYITECMRRVGIAPERLSAIFITHEHSDHIYGVGVMSRKFNVPVYANLKTWSAIGDSLGKIAPENQRVLKDETNIDNLTIKAFSIPHDAADPVGYTFLCDNHKFTIATDIGKITPDVLENLEGSDSIIVEANHDVDMLKTGRYPQYLKKRILGDKGHLSNELCGNLCSQLAQKGTSSFWLGHLSAENNRPELAYQTVFSALSDVENKTNGSISLNVLPRYWIG